MLILDVEEPIKIPDIARPMIDMSGEDIALAFTGLRPGEKLPAELVAEGEENSRPIHPKTSHARTDPLSPDLLDRNEWISRLQHQPNVRSAVSQT